MARKPGRVCRHRPLSERGAYEICKVCGWEDDPAQSADHPDLAGGANRESLNAARANWRGHHKILNP
ncbi:MAG: hypothetical protein JO056_10770 [Alphaproteobacteria bacterium]|nr:hypothetical protein [Alphaproteobacteria bacterium]